MKHLKILSLLLIITLTFCSSSFGQTKDSKTNYKENIYKVPQRRGYVNDFEGLYSNEQKEHLDSLIADFKNKTTIQIVIITIDSTMISKDDFDDFTLQILKIWGVGQKEKNNGVLIGISSVYGKIRIQNGYGIEKVLSNVQTKEIIDSYCIPSFKHGQMYNGTLEGLLAVIEKLK